jgi:hypothetical protein
VIITDATSTEPASAAINGRQISSSEMQFWLWLFEIVLEFFLYIFLALAFAFWNWLLRASPV